MYGQMNEPPGMDGTITLWLQQSVVSAKYFERVLIVTFSSGATAYTVFALLGG